MSAAADQAPRILSAGGDLAARLLLPCLGGLPAGEPGEGSLPVGSGSDDWDDERRRAPHRRIRAGRLGGQGRGDPRRLGP